MKLFVLLILIKFLHSQNDFLSNEGLIKLNEMEYYHESKIIGDTAEFIFIIYNTSYSRNVLDIDSYYFSITFIGEERREERVPIEYIPTNTTEYHGVLKMENLEHNGNYVICVFFLNETNLIVSSRFCHVVSVSNKCNLEISKRTFNNLHVFILIGFVLVLLLIIIIFSCIHRYINRPRTGADYIKLMSEARRTNLQTLGATVDDRRRRRTQHDLGQRIREESVHTINYDPNIDPKYFDYHGHDNTLPTVAE